MALYRFNLDKQFEMYGIDPHAISRKAIRYMQKNVNIALGEALKATRLATPHSGDGKPRGQNVISNSLYNSWHAKYSASGSRLGYLELDNARPYAKYVQEGHRMARHFVPWLYIDNNGLISRETNHSGKLFGLMVGFNPATSFVPGVDMTGPGVNAFMDLAMKSVFAAEQVQYEKAIKKQKESKDMANTELGSHFYSDKIDAKERKEISDIFAEVRTKAIRSIKNFLRGLF